MRKLTTILLLLITVTVFSQNKWFLIKSDTINKIGLPTKFNSSIGYVNGQYRQLPDSVYYDDGWRCEGITKYNTKTEKLGEYYFDIKKDSVYREIIKIKFDTTTTITQTTDTLSYYESIIKLFAKALNGDSLTYEEINKLKTLTK
jgi:hypothetical protein